MKERKVNDTKYKYRHNIKKITKENHKLYGKIFTQIWRLKNILKLNGIFSLVEKM